MRKVYETPRCYVTSRADGWPSPNEWQQPQHIRFDVHTARKHGAYNNAHHTVCGYDQPQARSFWADRRERLSIIAAAAKAIELCDALEVAEMEREDIERSGLAAIEALVEVRAITGAA